MRYYSKFINQSIRGRSHIKNDLPCQDKTYFIDNNNIKVISLSDGAGSCKYSDLGAEIATEVCADYVSKNFEIIYNDLDNEKVGKELFKKIIDQIKIEFENRELDIKQEDELDKLEQSSLQEGIPAEIVIQDYSSTLLFLAFFDGKYISGHIGDGLICISDEELKIHSNPENGETPNSTYFFTTKDAEKHLRLKKGIITNNTTFILMSDGTYECIYDKKENKFTNALFKFIDWVSTGKEKEVSDAIQLNMKKHFINKTSDDCSISIMHILIIKSFFDKVSDFFKN